MIRVEDSNGLRIPILLIVVSVVFGVVDADTMS